jgi:hypothetical protein
MMLFNGGGFREMKLAAGDRAHALLTERFGPDMPGNDSFE